MKLHQIISYSLMTAGSVAAAQSLSKRQRWEQLNTRVVIMLDWDDVQAVATRALRNDFDIADVASLLRRFRDSGATHLSIPELTLDRLLAKGQLSVTQGHSTSLVYLQAQSSALAARLMTELQARLPHIEVNRGKDNIISFRGDLPSVAEVGLGFDPEHAALAHQVELAPVARPIGYSWVQPEMIERTLNQAAGLGVKIVAVQGNLIPGHEFKIQHTVDAMKQHQLTYAYFRESRHQKGDWFLAKHLASSGLVVLAHEFEPDELLDEDWNTAAYRWANLATEAGVRLCSVRFFKILHAADPLESIAYIKELSRALRQSGYYPYQAGQADLTSVRSGQDQFSQACIGLSTAGAVGLASGWLPIPDRVKLLGIAAGAVTLGGLPYLGNVQSANRNHHHDHGHDHDHDHHHDHDHGHSHGHAMATAYAQKGLALAATVAFPAAATAISGGDPITAMAQTMIVGAAGATVVAATTVDTDYLMGIEEYRGYNLDWLLPIGLAACMGLLDPQNRKPNWRWLPLAGVGVAAWRSVTGRLAADLPATFDREHRHAHTHHLSEFQQQLGDLKMSLSPKPLRKWTLLAPLGVVSAAIFKQRQQDELASAALAVAAAGHVATLTGFRQGQRSLEKTLEGRVKGWLVGSMLAGAVWLVASLLSKKR